MPRNVISSLIIVCIALSSCKFECSVGGDTGTKSSQASSPKEKNGTLIANNIDLTVKNIKVKTASLQLIDKSRVADDNVIKLGEKVYLVLQLDSNWTVENGKSFIGASEKVSTDKGEVVLHAEDLFADYSVSGVDPSDAKLIQLNAVITKEVPGITYYKVDFRVWDKKGDAEITGNYKFYIKKD